MPSSTDDDERQDGGDRGDREQHPPADLPRHGAASPRRPLAAQQRPPPRPAPPQRARARSGLQARAEEHRLQGRGSLQVCRHQLGRPAGQDIQGQSSRSVQG